MDLRNALIFPLPCLSAESAVAEEVEGEGLGEGDVATEGSIFKNKD